MLHNATTDTITYAQAQQWLRQQLSDADLPSARTEAQQLLEGVSGLNRLQLLMQAQQTLPLAHWRQLQALAARRMNREPLQHLLGQVEWAGLNLQVSPAALIPRPETEVLLELACAEVQRLNLISPHILDVGTGTGALALCLKQRFPEAQVVASDISPQALALAHQNAQRHGLEVQFVHSDLLTDIHGTFDLLLSNPPYLPSGDAQHIQPEVKHDPALALYGGPDGLSLARQLIQQAPRVLKPLAPVLLELDPRNAPVLLTELQAQGWQGHLHADLVGRERFVALQQPQI